MTVISEAQTAPVSSEDEYVFFHSGTEAGYRRVNKKASEKGHFTSIPTIDLSKIDSDSLEERKKIAKEIYDACSTSGFLYFSNHGIPEDAQARIFDTMKRFFALDIDVKMDGHSHKNAAIRGYEPMLETRLDPRTKGDIKEAYTMGDCVIEPEQHYREQTGHDPPPYITKPQNVWPSEAPFFRQGMYEYYSHVYPLARKLIRLFALSFDLDETAFDKDFKFPIWGLRALHYPPMPPGSEAHAVGLGAHADFSWITLLLQDDVSALEILNKDGIWIDVPPKPGTLVCNIGQYLEKQTNGKFVATVHRVRNKTGQRRYSIPFFLSQDPDVNLEVLDCCVEPGEEKPPVFNVGDLYIRKVLPARKKHPTSIKYKDVPETEWRYDFLYAK